MKPEVSEVCYAMYELNIKLKDNRYLVVSYFDNNTDNIINILLESMVVQPRVPVPESENGVSCTLRTLFLKGIFTLLFFFCNIHLTFSSPESHRNRLKYLIDRK